MAAVVLIVVIVVVGGAGYAGLNAVAGNGGKQTSSSCSPASAPQCGGQGKLNDVVLFVAYQPGVGQHMITVNNGQSLPATVSLSGGESASSFSVFWGDTHNTTQTSTTFTHAYNGLGEFVISATATVNGVTHTGTNYLYPVSVIPTLADSASGQFPTLVTTLTNGSASGSNYYPFIHAGGQVSVSASYATLPTASGYTAGSPKITSTGGTAIDNSNTTISAAATYSFANPGYYWMTFVGPVTGPSGTVYQNYTWGVFVGAAGLPLSCTNCKQGGGQGVTSPHTGSLYVYEIVPGGATSLDPAVDYETTGGEIIQNVYETLVQYAGDSTASYVPVLSMCVPGPAASGPGSCQAQYGSDLQTGNYWTFPINPNASFYDPSTHSSWGVYPSDVMFSVARTLMWLQTPSQYTTNGWIIGQALLPYGTHGFDGGIHTPWNNTPQNVYGAFLVNDSTYCPTAAMTHAHGCITFDAAGSGAVWPEILEFIQDSEGASVVPCGWFTSLGAGLPGFTTNAAHGDGPCLLPGGGTTTNASAFTSYVSGANPKLFDPIIALDATNIYQPQPQVRWNIVGSGPYYLESVNQGQGYILKANPAYTQPNCAGLPGCYAAANAYANTVYVFWGQNSVTGVEQYIAGQSDVSTFFPTDIPTILNLVHAGKVGLFTLPTLNLFPEGFSEEFTPSVTQSDSGLTTNIQGNFFSYVGMREFFAATFPYNTYITVDNTEDGIPFIQGEGGAIPDYLGNYYPANVTWPGLNTTTGAWMDPNTAASASVQGSPAWWWAQLTTSGSTYYDPEAAACMTTTCNFPIGSELGDTPFDAAVDAWSSIINTVTHGAIVTSRWDPTFSQIVINLGTAPPGSGFDTFVAGWLPNYPDPTDYMVPFYMPDGSYTYSAGLNETLVGSGLYNGCSANAADTWANVDYWANVATPSAPLITNACQGTAYAVMTWAMIQAASMPDGPARVLAYNLVEHIANELVLFVYNEQQVGLGSYASWVNPAGIWTNVVAPGQLWFQWYGNGVV